MRRQHICSLLIPVCREHFDDLSDCKVDIVLTDTFRHDWQTEASMKATRLAFNDAPFLWLGSY